MEQIKAVIIDDESKSIGSLTQLLKVNCPDVSLMETFTNPDKGIAYLKEHPADLLFLDIQMPGKTGFDVLEALKDVKLKVIFTTAYDHFAIKAIRYNALDYLMKPVAAAELVTAIERSLQQAEVQGEQIAQLQKFRNDKVPETIALSTSEGLAFIKLEDIMYLEGQGSYTYVTLSGGRKHLVSKNLSAFEEIICDEQSKFFRPHKSFIINLAYISQYIKGDGGEIIMNDKKSVTVSRLKKQEFLDLFTRV